MPSMVAIVNQAIPHRTRESRVAPTPTTRTTAAAQPHYRTAPLPTTTAPAVQPPSPRVQFRSPSTLVEVSRPLTVEENWTLYNFETHSRACNYCQHPYKRWQSGAPLCSQGQALAQKVAHTCFLHGGETGEIYERHTRHKKPMRLEVPHTYTFVREQLRVIEEASLHRTAPRPTTQVPKVRIHTEPRHTKTPKRSENTEAVIEASRGDKREKHYRREKYRHEDRDRKYRHEDKEYRREGYRHEERRDRHREDAEVVVGEKRYRTKDRVPTWVEQGKSHP